MPSLSAEFKGFVHQVMIGAVGSTTQPRKSEAVDLEIMFNAHNIPLQSRKSFRHAQNFFVHIMGKMLSPFYPPSRGPRVQKFAASARIGECVSVCGV